MTLAPPYPAVEFDEYTDALVASAPQPEELAAVLAQALVELDMLAGRAAANRVLNRTIARTGWVGLVAGLPQQMARYRGEDAAGLGYLRPAPPVVVAVGGLPGVGKSTLARALAPELGPAPGALVLRSDEIRKRRFGVKPECRLPQAAYRQGVSRGVLAELCQGVAEAVAAGHAVIADAMFLNAADRQTIARAAGSAHFIGAWLRAPLGVLEARVAARAGDASDADLAVLSRVARADCGASDWLEVDSTDAAAALALVRHHLPVLSC